MTPRRDTSHRFDRITAAVAETADLAGRALISKTAGGRLLVLAGAVPPVVHSFGFECRLSAEDERVDLGIGVSPLNGARTALGRIGDGAASTRLDHDERWQRIGHLARAWNERGSPMRAWASFLFLEFDGEVAAQPVPAPSIFVGLDSPLEGSSASTPELRAAQHAVSLLLPEDGASSERLRRAFGALPTGARVLHVGVMLGRPAPSVRLSVLIPGSESARYLHRLGAHRAGDLAQLAQRGLGGLLELAQLDFDLGPASGERIGFGLYPADRSPSGWKTLLQRLSATAPLSAPKCEALLRWPGTSAFGGWWLHREISHVKLACATCGPPQLKAYFGVTPLRS